MARVYCAAYGHDGKQILGNMDGQLVATEADFRRAAWFKALPTLKTLNGRVAKWIISDYYTDKVLATVEANHG